MNIDAIGEDDAALLCHTDKHDCCVESNKAGEWFFPSGTQVRVKNSSQEFYRNRGMQVVRLNHRQGSFTDLERGLFRCEIPDSSNMTQTVYVHIGISF